MGCDIHEYVEMQIGGVWVYAGDIILHRNYLLFAVLADVRNDEIGVECVSGEHKELPEDISPHLLELSEAYGQDGHSHSYLDLAELEEAKKIYESFDDAGDRYKFPAALESLKELMKLPFVENVRFVFWFDN